MTGVYGVIETGTIEVNDEMKRYFNQDGYEMTGETITWGTELCNSEKIVFTGEWTRHGTIRDCGDHYIYAGYDTYYRIEKETFEVTEDVEDR